MSLTTRRLMRVIVLASHGCRFPTVATCSTATRRIICVTCGSCSEAGDHDRGILSRDTSMSRDNATRPTRRCILDPSCCGEQSVAVLLDAAARAIAWGHSTPASISTELLCVAASRLSLRCGIVVR